MPIRRTGRHSWWWERVVVTDSSQVLLSLNLFSHGTADITLVRQPPALAPVLGRRPRRRRHCARTGRLPLRRLLIQAFFDRRRRPLGSVCNLRRWLATSGVPTPRCCRARRSTAGGHRDRQSLARLAPHLNSVQRAEALRGAIEIRESVSLLRGVTGPLGINCGGRPKSTPSIPSPKSDTVSRREAAAQARLYIRWARERAGE
jgi:hypothetical protein